MKCGAEGILRLGAEGFAEGMIGDFSRLQTEVLATVVRVYIRKKTGEARGCN
jgi:hypothetical protein